MVDWEAILIWIPPPREGRNHRMWPHAIHAEPNLVIPALTLPWYTMVWFIQTPPLVTTCSDHPNTRDLSSGEKHMHTPARQSRPRADDVAGRAARPPLISQQPALELAVHRLVNLVARQQPPHAAHAAPPES